MMKWTVPEPWSRCTVMSPEGPSEMIALLARVWPGRQFMTETRGRPTPAGKTRRSPRAVGWVTVKLNAIALVPGGMPHWLAMTKVRSALAASAGPPYGPAGLRVSATRHGVTVKNCVPVTGDVVTVRNEGDRPVLLPWSVRSGTTLPLAERG